jgi:PAS domain S-box-containing protein
MSSARTPSRARIDAQLAAWRSTRPGRLMLLGVSIGLVAAVYYAAAKIGLRLAYLNGTVTALWPPVGVGIAALVLYGTRLWPGIVIGDLLVADFSSPLGTVLGQTLGNTLEVVVAAVILRRLVGTRTGLEQVRDVFALVAAAALGTLISASFGATSLRLGDVIAQGQFAEVWRTWWLSDFSGALVVTPLILTWATRGVRGLSRWDLVEGAVLIAALVLLAELPSQRDVPYVVFPVLIWAALRFGPRGASTALVIVAGLTVWNTAHNAGPFVRQSITDSLLSSQLFLATAALTALVLAAVTAERARADEALRANEERLRSVVQSMAEGLIVRDASGVITDCNAAAEQIIGLARDRLRGRRPEAILGAAVDADDRPLSGGRLLGDEALATGDPQAPLTVRLTRPDGTPAWIWISSAPVLDAGGRPEGVVSTMSDVTQSREAEQRLVASELATRALADEQAALRRIATLVASEAPPSSVFERVTEEVARLLDAPSAGVLRYENDLNATVVGSWREAGLVGLPLGSSVDLDGDSVVARVYRSGQPERIDNYHEAPGALAERLRGFGYQSSVAAPVSVGARLWGVLVASTTESERLVSGSERRLLDFAELVAQALSNADAYDKLAGSRARIVEAGDAERRRLERNLHDGVQQRMLAVSYELRLARGAAAAAGVPELEATLITAVEQAQEAASQLRDLAHGIYPAILTDAGLGLALESLAESAPLPVVVLGTPDQRLPEPVERAAYLVAAGSIDAGLDAGAGKISIRVARTGDHLVIEAEGAGTGPFTDLADRVGAIGGRLAAGSLGLRAEIPCA